MPRMLTRTLTGAAVALMLAPMAAQAQSQPSLDWNGNFTFRNAQTRLVDLVQADLIRRAEQGTFERWRTRNSFNAITYSALIGRAGVADDFYESGGGFVSVDRSGDFWSDWSVGGVTITR